MLILLNNEYGIYNPNHAKYKYSTIQLKSMLDYTMIRKCKVGITTLTDTTNNTTTATNNTTTSTTHNPMADQRTSVDDSTIVPQTVYFMPEVCELDSTPNSHTFQTGIQHQQQHQHEIQSPPCLHRITHNQVTRPTDTTYTSPSSSFDFPNLDREMIKNEEVDKMMSGIVERMKIGTADNNLIFEEVALTQKEINSQTTYSFLKMVRIPLVPKLLQLLLSEISQLSSSHPECNILTIQTSDRSSQQLVMVPQTNDIDVKLNRPVKSIIKNYQNY